MTGDAQLFANWTNNLQLEDALVVGQAAPPKFGSEKLDGFVVAEASAMRLNFEFAIFAREKVLQLSFKVGVEPLGSPAGRVIPGPHFLFDLRGIVHAGGDLGRHADHLFDGVVMVHGLTGAGGCGRCLLSLRHGVIHVAGVRPA
jgi:hypothetical protein